MHFNACRAARFQQDQPAQAGAGCGGGERGVCHLPKSKMGSPAVCVSAWVMLLGRPLLSMSCVPIDQPHSHACSGSSTSPTDAPLSVCAMPKLTPRTSGAQCSKLWSCDLPYCCGS